MENKNKPKNGNKSIKTALITTGFVVAISASPFAVNYAKSSDDSLSISQSISDKITAEELKETLFFENLVNRFGENYSLDFDESSVFTTANITFQKNIPYSSGSAFDLESPNSNHYSWEEVLKDLHYVISKKSSTKLDIKVEYSDLLDLEGKLISECLWDNYEIYNTANPNIIAIKRTIYVDRDNWKETYSLFNAKKEHLKFTTKDKFKKYAYSESILDHTFSPAVDTE